MKISGDERTSEFWDEHCLISELHCDFESYTFIDYFGYLRNWDTMRLIHREIMERERGKIPYGWVVHHVDGNKLNNTLNNLFALPLDLHRLIHKEALNQGNLPNRAILFEILDEWLRWSKE